MNIKAKRKKRCLCVREIAKKESRLEKKLTNEKIIKVIKDSHKTLAYVIRLCEWKAKAKWVRPPDLDPVQIHCI